MTKHILLTFLSDVKKNRKDSQTRPNLVSKSKFEGLGDTYTTNESALLYILKYGWKEEPVRIERIFTFASKRVYQNPVGAVCEGYRFPEASVDENGNSLTHFAYFRKRVADIVDVDRCIPITGIAPEYEETVLKYNEASPYTSDTMGAVIGMAGKIQHYLRSVKEKDPDEPVVLHADMTGGFRHAAMMMIAVMRLIQFEGITIGHVLYSNWTPLANNPEYNGEGVVQEVGEIYGMYDLISGAEEFTNFGSVKTFGKYFSEREQSDVLHQLLRAMEKFDAAVKVSRRRVFGKAVHELKEQLDNFQRSVASWTRESDAAKIPSGLNDLLMFSLQNRIEQEYKELFEEEADELVFVKWCLKHGYLQQALTLYTECFLDFLKDNKLIVITDKGQELIDRTQPEDDPRDPLFYLLSECVPDEIPVLWLPEAQFENINRAIKRYLENLNVLAKAKESLKRNPGKQQLVSEEDMLREIISWRNKTEELLQEGCRKHKRPIYENDRVQILECLDVIGRLKINGYENVLREMNEREINRIQGLSKFEVGDIDDPDSLKRIKRELGASIKGTTYSKNSLPKILNRDKLQWDRKYKRCSKVEMLLYCGDIEIGKTKPEDMLPVLDSYFMIRAIRNDVAHAKKENEDVKDLDTKTIQGIVEEAIKSVRAIQNGWQEQQ